VRTADALREAAIDSVDARLLLQHVLGTEHATLIAHPEFELSAAQQHRFATLIEQRRRGVPVAYLVGMREFYGREFRIDGSVLIPRPETELLIDNVLRRIGTTRPLRVLDLGTGSGVLAITLALERPDWRVTASDVSADALEVARANAHRLGAANVEFLRGDWFTPLSGSCFELIVCNPPYVAANDSHLQQGDLRFEPGVALIGGADGLSCIRTIVQKATEHLVPGGWLLFEHGYDQAECCAELLRANGYSECFLATDLAGLARVSGARFCPPSG
jgi:release factor glutamine methyltransferase